MTVDTHHLIAVSQTRRSALLNVYEFEAQTWVISNKPSDLLTKFKDDSTMSQPDLISSLYNQVASMYGNFQKFIRLNNRNLTEHPLNGLGAFKIKALESGDIAVASPTQGLQMIYPNQKTISTEPSLVWDIYSRDEVTLATEIRIVSNDNYLQYNQPFRVDFDYI